MGKNKKLQKKQMNKNVFKVATVRSVKLKAKAQKVMINLKKLDLKKNKTIKKNTDKTVQIDQQFQELRREVNKSKLKIKTDAKQNKKKKMENIALVQTDITTSLVDKMQI